MSKEDLLLLEGNLLLGMAQVLLQLLVLQEE